MIRTEVKAAMASSNCLRLSFRAVFMVVLVACGSFAGTLGHETSNEREIRYGERTRDVVPRRALLSFRETPHGGNATFECSPSGPCIPCLYSEKNDEKYHCSETGYRIPLKCIKLEDNAKATNNKKSKDSRSTLENPYSKENLSGVLQDTELTTSITTRRLLDDSSRLDDSSQAYITYRSCIPAVNEEKLSVLGFEGIMFGLLLLSGSFVYFRRKHAVATSGIGGLRMQTNSRF